jgi:hypothetical protein
MSKFFSRRFSISNIADYTQGEAPFARTLADIIESKTPTTAPVSLDAASWLELLKVLRRFVKVVDPAQRKTGNDSDSFDNKGLDEGDLEQ